MKKIKILYFVVIGIIVILLIWFIRIITAKVEVNLVDDLTINFNKNAKVSDFIQSINGKIIDDYQIDTTKVGEREVKFYFKNNDNIKVSYTYKISVVDKEKPLIWLNKNYNVKKDSDISLIDAIMCGDNYDDNPKKEIIGDYDLSVTGTYNLVYKATDSSGNVASKEFNLNVYELVESSVTNTSENPIEPSYNNFEDIKNTYKNDNTKIGIDVSKWQGDIDFKALKKAGVEFVMIRLGGNSGKDYFIDKTFKDNMKKAKKAKMPVGVYFYSYASSSKQAKKDAKWVIKQLKKYDIKYPVAFDWEEWKNFNDYNLSFFSLTSMAEDFMKVIEDNGYDAMLYSSKTYLDNIWMETRYDIWIAHYNKNASYEGKYKMWQLCNNGKVDGINGMVDIDVWYEKN